MYSLWAGLLLGNCSSSEASPEQVVATYVQLLNQGQLQAAKQWCTPAGVAHLEALEAIMEASTEPLDSSAVELGTIRCREQPTGLRCEVQILDGFGPHTEYYDLVYGKAGWRVDQAIASGPTETRQELRINEDE